MVHLQFSEGDSPSKLENAAKESMQKHIEHLNSELKKLRTGRAHVSLIEDITVECYGSSMKLRDVATITAPEAQLLVIQPWDQNNIGSIERGIVQSELNLNPQNDGSIIRLAIPPMTSEKREQLVKNMGKKQEDSKVGVRNVRKEFLNFIRECEKNKNISEDTSKRLQASLQKVTDEFTSQVDALCAKKEREIRSI